MSLLTIPEVRAIVSTNLSDEALQDVIDREEAWLAREIGPLSGPRTVTITYPTRYAPVVLRHGATDVTVTDAGSTVTTTLAGTSLERSDRLAWIGPVVVEYIPGDEDMVRSVVIDMVRAVLERSGYQSETIGDYSYQRGGSGTSRRALARSLLPGSYQPTTISLQPTYGYRR